MALRRSAHNAEWIEFETKEGQLWKEIANILTCALKLTIPI